jgi:hypothetical protein
MAKTNTIIPVTPTGPIDCACVIHGDAYPWTYVERLYNMLQRNISPGIRLHVYTEAHRPVPEPLIKHELIDWGISGPKRGWWYKLQLFNSANFAGPLLYFDLDTVIVGNIDWIWNLPLRYFWTVQDFKYLWRPTHQGINSSIMWWDTRLHNHIWRNFDPKEINTLIKIHPGDQDYLTQNLDARNVRFFPQERVTSWRWQCKDGGYNFKQRMYQTPGSGTMVQKNTSVLVFHGKPKPAEITDPVILEHWR